MDDLQQMIPETVEVEVGGEKLVIGPIRMRQLSKVTRNIGGLVEYFKGEEIDFQGLLTEGAEDLAAALAAATDKPAEWIGDLNLHDVVTLTRAVVEVNADFFARTVMPEVEKATKVFNQLGRTSSNA